MSRAAFVNYYVHPTRFYGVMQYQYYREIQKRPHHICNADVSQLPLFLFVIFFVFPVVVDILNIVAFVEHFEHSAHILNIVEIGQFCVG